MILVVRAPQDMEIPMALESALQGWLSRAGLQASIETTGDGVELDLDGMDSAECRFVQRSLVNAGYVVDVVV